MYKKFSFSEISEDTLLRKSLQGLGFTREELHYLLFEADLEWLGNLANKIKKITKGETVYLRAIVEFSNYCKNNCLYCGIRRDNRKLRRYRMLEKEIIAQVEKIITSGFKTVVLQSGEDPIWSSRRLANLVKEIKKLGIVVTLSIGELTYREYSLLKEAGADRFLLKHETIDEKLFSWLKPDTTLPKRIRCLYWLKSLGYEVGCGCIIGLPGQRLDSLIEDLMFIQELKPEMVGHGPFIPHPQTPLASFPPGSPHLTLRLIALTRIILPQANIPATTALGVLAPFLKFKAFLCGANVLMLDLTPTIYRTHYEIYPGKGRHVINLNTYLDFFKKIGLKPDLLYYTS